MNIDVAQDDVCGQNSLGMINLIVSLDQLFDVKFDILEISEMNKVFVIKELLVDKEIQF